MLKLSKVWFISSCICRWCHWNWKQYNNTIQEIIK